jgi:hypothetical protein
MARQMAAQIQRTELLTVIWNMDKYNGVGAFGLISGNEYGYTWAVVV